MDYSIRSVRLVWMASVVVVAVVGAIIAAGNPLARSRPELRPGPVSMARLSEVQYRNVIRDVFGSTIEVGGRFPPDLRADGLLAVGNSEVGATAAAVEQYSALARKIAEQVVAPENRLDLLPCKPDNEKLPDDICSRQFLEKVALHLYRRPITEESLAAYVGAARAATELVPNYYYGLSLSLAAMLSSPQFLFREAVLKKDRDHPGKFRMDGYSRASQLSFLLWNSGPDPVLYAAAAAGTLDTRAGIDAQVQRMSASPRFQDGLRAFFIDFLHFDEMAEMRKDTLIYPKFNSQTVADAQEQTMRTILGQQNADYRDIFTARKTWLTRELGAIYQVPLASELPNGAPDTWQPYEFAKGDSRSGVLTHLSFTALHSHPGRSSPTLRGAALREIFMCQTVPPPPGNVVFDLDQDDGAIHKTTRERLAAHRKNVTCSGCHNIMDPMGLALESFDGLGAFRTEENGVAIDLSGELDGVKFNESAGLGEALRANSAVVSCVVNRMTAYALGREPTSSETRWVHKVQHEFEAGGYQIAALMKTVASTEAYAALPAPRKTVKASFPLPVLPSLIATAHN